MKLADIVSFRKDLLFNGAVQIGWLENNREQAEKAAQHFIFHGPEYHGVTEDDFRGSVHKLLDTASFTLDIVERINGIIADEPFSLAIAGYGTGKSHLAVTLTSLLSAPETSLADKILDNVSRADSSIGARIRNILESTGQPFLVVAINGMQDFDLNNEIIRQVLDRLNREELDTSVLENLRPRFKTAISFTESFFTPLKEDFQRLFGSSCNLQDIIDNLKCQNEDTFSKVSAIYYQKMGSPIHAVGQESLHDFIRVAKETFCGPGKPFAGILIIFDEFGRYLEFAVQKPHVAGSGALQQLFECVQANTDGVFLLCFIQYELKAYISRIAPELREDLNRYVTRYDTVRKVRLSTNLETLIANLLEKKEPGLLQHHLEASSESAGIIQSYLRRWFPDMRNHAIWMDKEGFERVIYKGCWPLHPLSTLTLYKLSSAGKSLQQRSALSLLAEVFDSMQNLELAPGKFLTPVDLCNEAMINEFLASEQYGQLGATAHAYENVVQKYQHELSDKEIRVLKAVLTASKIGIKVDSKEDCQNALSLFSGLEVDEVYSAVHLLESEYAVLAWNEQLNQYEIVGDAVPKRAFIAELNAKVAAIDAQTRSDIFSQNFKKWLQMETFNTDFGSQNNIETREWNYQVSFSSISILKGQIDYALRTWRDARNVDEEKGRLIYCYVGAESNIKAVQEMVLETIKDCMKKNEMDWRLGAPLAVILLHDKDGTFGKSIAEYWVLNEQMGGRELEKYANFILDTKNSVLQKLQNQFSALERERLVLFATAEFIEKSRIKNMLTELFNVVYKKRVSFPFDGFYTTRGNAARDCQLFTKELFRGTLNRDWIATCNQQQKNRAYRVLDDAWGFIDSDGSIRLKPIDRAAREIIEILEEQIEKTDTESSQKPVNLGKIMRLVCAPPYGCNIASAGMLLAIYIGRRKNSLNLLKNKEAISIENWIQDAIPGNFLDLSVLDITEVVQVSKESMSEWEKLLDEWSIEKTILGKIDYRRKVKELKKRMPIPQMLYYKYAHLYEQSKEALNRLVEFNNTMNSALSKIEKGIEKDKVSLLSWGAADLVDLYNMMNEDDEQWTKEQMSEVEKNIATARVQAQKRFAPWLKRQVVHSIENLSKFKHDMLDKVRNSLLKIGLTEESRLLEEHVEKVEKHIIHLTEIKRTAADIEHMLQANKITDTTPVLVINNWLDQVQQFAERLELARNKTSIAKDVIFTAKQELAKFQKACNDQLKKYQERMTNVYNLDHINSLSDIANWRVEVATLISIYEGQQQDVEDLKMVQRQLDLVEEHLRQLDNVNYNEEEFEAAVKRCKEENEKEFHDDAPPLDNDLIYESIFRIIKEKRERYAMEWMRNNVPNMENITEYNASKAMDFKVRLQTIPRVLSGKQKDLVLKALEACEKRLDELEIEGLLARFNKLSEEKKRNFFNKLLEYFKYIENR